MVDVCQSNQQQLSLLRGEVSQLRDELRAVRAAPAPSPQAASVRHTRAPTRASGPGSQSHATCHFAGCSQQVSTRCPVQFCRARCTSSRCLVHTGRSPTRSRQCMRNGCTTVVPRSCTSGFCEAHARASVGRLYQDLFCSSSACGEVPSPGCVVGMCETHCNHPQCSPPAPPASSCFHFQSSSEPQSRDMPPSLFALNACTRSVAFGIALCIVPAVGASSTMLPKRFGGGNPMSDGPAIPARSFQVASFNARRLWQRDQSAHDGFHMLSGILSAEEVDVLCIQEVFAGDFPRLLVNQPYSFDGPSESRGREAGFLVHNGVSSAEVPGVPDSLSVRWRIFAGVVCVCSFYAPHAGTVLLRLNVCSSGRNLSQWPGVFTLKFGCP